MTRKKPDRLYRVSDANNGCEIAVQAKSVAHAASIGRKGIAALMGKQFRPWQTDSATGGWQGISIELPECVHVRPERPTPRPESNKRLWKQKQGA